MKAGRRRWGAMIVIVLLVIGLHALLLWALGRGFQRLDPVERLTPPIYTRLLRPTPPKPVPQPRARPRPVPKPSPKATTQPPLAPHRTAHPPAALPPHVALARPDAPIEPTAIDQAEQTSAPAPQPSPAPAASTPATPAESDGFSRPGSSGSTPAGPASNGSSPTAGPAPGWPPSTQIDYALSGYWRGALHGSGELLWTRDGDRYAARLSGRALVSFSYTSSGQIAGDWLVPARYAERLFTRHKAVSFDRVADLVRFDNGTQAAPIPPDLQDSASLFLQIAHRLTVDPGAFAPGATLTFKVARPSGLTDWTFTVIGQDLLETPLGPLRCWHVERPAAAGNQLGAAIWLAPSLQNLPVRIRLLHGDDSTLEFNITAARQVDQDPSATTVH